MGKAWSPQRELRYHQKWRCVRLEDRSLCCCDRSIDAWHMNSQDGGQSMTKNTQPVELAGSALSHSCHVCAFFHSKEDEYSVLMPFIKDGFKKGDRAFHVVDARRRADHLRRLEQEGIDVAAAESSGQLEVRRWEEAYIKDAYFDQYRMIETIRDALNPAKKQPGQLTRLVANMEWALEDLPG